MTYVKTADTMTYEPHTDSYPVGGFDSIKSIVERGEDNLKLCDKPLATKWFKSYRYKSQYGGWLMIGAKDTADALNEASRTIRAEPDITKLQVFENGAYCWLA